MKKAYSTPKLSVYGTVEQITQKAQANADIPFGVPDTGFPPTSH
jgi:hypothetical protein